ncbi:HBL/NHE enterotoxin family protein [Bacillus cereus]|uniref:HBL/NHE enterotoxin family protein n=1 Tax=Bacillus cereus TaxID=1396 RepID=UPI001F0A9B85|nr:HBL/NHE enterotoxin family protein [Bacillus cereus]
MALSTLVTTLAMGSMVPSYASAAGNTTNATQALASKYSNYGLGPEALKKAITETKSNMLVMDLYALTLVKQPVPDLNGLTAISTTLKTNVKTNFENSRKDADTWLDDLKPKIISVNQSIINYDTKFQTYCNTLIRAAKENNIPILRSGLTRLLQDITKNKGDVTQLLEKLRDYRSKLTTSTQNFKDYSNEVTNILTGQDAGIPLMEQQLATNQELIDKNNKLLAASITGTAVGSWLTATIVLAPFGAPILGVSAYGVDSLNKQIAQARNNIIELTKNISETRVQAGKLGVLKNTTDELTKTIDLAIDALQNISNQWNTMEAKYNSVLQNLKTVDPEFVDFLELDLEVSQTSWADVRKHAEALQNSEIKYVEDKK